MVVVHTTTDCFVLRLPVCGFSVASTGSPLLVVTFGQILVTFQSDLGYVRSDLGYVQSNLGYVHSNLGYVQSNLGYVQSNRVDSSQRLAGPELEGLCGEQIATSRVSRYVFLYYRQFIFIRRIFWSGQRFPSLERGKSLLSSLQLDHDCCTL